MTVSHQQLRRWATYASVSVASILILGKLAAYLLTDSIAILSSLVDSTVDLLASLVTMLGVASAMKPPDRHHRFGHGKAEALAALAQAAFIVGSCAILGYEAILGIAAVLSGNAWRVARDALNVLMDRELSDGEREKILQLVQQHPRVAGVHDLRTRSDGERAFVNFHLELDGGTSLSEAFATTTEIRAMIQQHFANADVMIHLDPAGLEEMRGDTLIEQATTRPI
ncbi:MAG: hypothetical protein EBV03_11565 [Proteobacteria bacterium]|nr:hypothetical protein [Pseudomonadota bacterium]